MEWSEQFEIIKEKISADLAKSGTSYSLNRAAAYLGVGIGRVRAWTRGQRPSADDLERIGRRLHLSARWLLFGEGVPEAQAEGEARAECPQVSAHGGSAAEQYDPLVQRMETLDRLMRAANAPDEDIRAALIGLVHTAQSEAPATTDATPQSPHPAKAAGDD